MFVLRAQQFWIQWVGSIILRVWIQWVRSIIFRNLLDAAYPSYPAVWWIQWGIVSKGIRVGDIVHVNLAIQGKRGGGWP